MRTLRICLLVLAGLMATAGVQAKKKDIISQEKGKSITFRVDPDLPEPTGEGLRMMDSGRLISEMLNREEIPGDAERVVGSGLGDGQIAYYGESPFFKGMIEAFADHRPVVLSPDVIWFLICQGFAHYVNDNPEELRNLFVDHEGKIDLVVQSSKELLEGNADWDSIVDGFYEQIRDNTKGEIADILAQKFSTTGVNEHIVSEIVLMETVKSYFNYIVMYLACGIPSITLTGTPDDWQSILDRTRKLSAYGIDWWVKDLEPILTEFVKASKGKPDVNFWKSIVKKYRPGETRGLSCGMDRGSTKFDGWFLKLMPYDRSGRTPAEVNMDHGMLPQMVRTDYKYIIFNDFTGEKEQEMMMEFWAGIVGWDVDPETFAMTPKLGWFTRVKQTEEELLADLKSKDSDEEGWGEGINLRVNRVPDIIRKMGRINSLSLTFDGKVVIPDWMDGKDIGSLTISGSMTPEEEAALKARFPNANIRRQR
jgi:hypothetical protein